MPARALRTAALAVAALLLPAGAAHAGTANAGLPTATSNPIAGITWGTYTGGLDGVYPAYEHAQGQDKQLLGKIALRPLVFWFGAWDKDGSVRSQVRSFLDNVTGGNPDVMAQIALFRLNPWESQACTHLPNPAAQASYKRWIDQVALAIGTTRVAVILQPDLPFALCPPRHRGSKLQLGLVRYAAQKLSVLPYTTVYIDAGAADWISPKKAVWLLTRAGVKYTRGFSVNDTHLDSTQNELEFGAAVVKRLGQHGIHNMHFVVNTSTNGHPFLFYKRHGKGDPPTCNTGARYCAALGIPPTTDTADPRWGLSSQAASIAASEADGYLWIGRPWLDHGSYPFDQTRAIGLAASSPF